ncbi:hypothetical protein CWI85_34970 [Streptomyces albidoflavus]|uniref:hypothetical protein n=1 Tax=Streptomyces albidoflavus TaxID=1886 RepID=UPI0004CB446F|nr:hypothetical protein [Streptomyces albidoflavus]PJT46122.1 hypothetical protein CWI85_34970 [Streptomyces albidoflavus]
MTKYAIPSDLEEEVVRLLYRRAADLNWTYLTDTERTRHYQTWTSDPEVGGRLLPFIGKPENVRPWLKDRPMKEYIRATYGVGKWAPLVVKPATPVSALVDRALGSGWNVDIETLDIKPLCVTIRHEDDEEMERRFAWGPMRDFKHLAWAAIVAQAGGDALPWVICTVDSFVRKITPEQRATNERIAKRLGLISAHVTDG